MRPLLLDLFCGAGGSAKGYHDAGFDVVGMDLHPQRNYPFEFRQGNAIRFLQICNRYGWNMDGRPIAAVHASPPCQAYSAMSQCRPGLADKYPRLIAPTRELLQQTDRPWVIENVVGAPLIDPIMLCGTMFGLELYRHRLFESNVALTEPLHPAHVKPASKAGHWVPGTIMSVSGHIAPIAHARAIMGIDWTTRDELAESIPPAYTEHLGAQLLKVV